MTEKVFNQVNPNLGADVRLYISTYLIRASFPHIQEPKACGQRLVRVSVTVMLPCSVEPAQGTPVKSLAR